MSKSKVSFIVNYFTCRHTKQSRRRFPPVCVLWGGFSFLAAWWMKLFVSQVERARRLGYLLPEGRRPNRLCDTHNQGSFSGEAGDVSDFYGMYVNCRPKISKKKHY